MPAKDPRLLLQHLLITQRAFFDVAGSEVVAWELARHFASRGTRVTIATYGYSAAWQSQFASVDGITVRRIDDVELDKILQDDPPELAWIQHQVIPLPLLDSPGSTQMVFHHMSAFEPQEFPVFSALESQLASLVVFPAEETLQAQLATGLFDDVDPERLRVFGNPAPDEYLATAPVTRTPVQKLLVVSNHPPQELIDGLALLDELEVEFVGHGADAELRQRLLSPEDLDGVDAVISIGKTVQYCIARAVPIYCYDHFGGPGWLDSSNFSQARFSNFSGRGFTKKQPEEIAHEIRARLGDMSEVAESLHDAYAARFTLTVALEETLNPRVADTTVPRIDSVTRTEFALYQTIMNGLVNTIESRR